MVKRPYSCLNVDGSIVAVKAQHGCIFDTPFGRYVCDPNTGEQYYLSGETLDDAMFIEQLIQLATANDWRMYYVTRTRALKIVPYWVWLKLWNGYSTVQSLPYARLKNDRDNWRLARR